MFYLSGKPLSRISPYLPISRAVRRVDDPRVISGIIHVIKRSLQWRDTPKEYGSHKTLYNHFVRWRMAGIFDKILASLAEEGGDGKRLMIDTTHTEARRTVANLHKKGMFPALSAVRKVG